MASPPLFTVEQVELIRRLKNSGITRHQLLQAFDSLQRLDNELGQVYSVPVSQSPITPNGIHHLAITENDRTPGSGPIRSADVYNGPNIRLSASKRLYGTAFGEDLNGSQDSSDSNAELVSNDELMTYLRTKPEDHLVEDIREFAVKHSIRQHHIASAAGISQSYVSRFFRGDFFEMSESSRQRIYKWYLWCQKNPEAATNPYTYASMFGGHKERSYSTNDLNTSLLDDKGMRRERFTFSAAQVAILENEFLTDNYPSTERREQLVELCSKEGQPIQGRKMCADVIANWFSNKRKEIKKLALKEGIIIESCRGRRPLVKNWAPVAILNGNVSETSVPHQVLDTFQESPGLVVKSENVESDGSEAEDSKQESLAFAVEVAAVNEAIKVLSGQPRVASLDSGLSVERDSIGVNANGDSNLSEHAN